MGRIICGDNEALVKDGDKIIEACESLGVPFACYVGQCGTCRIEILEGEDNLSPLTPEEEAMSMDKKHRLACQCILISGDVKIKF